MKQREDVVVIGGGVIGVCAAYYLLKEGRQVTILERAEVCSGSSYGNGGLIVPSHSMPLPVPGAAMRALKWMLDPESPFYIRPRFSLDLFCWLWRFRAASTERRMRNSVRVLLDLSQPSRALYDELIAQEGIECNYQKRGALLLYKTDHGFKEGLGEAQLIQEHGLPTKLMTGPEVHEMEPQVRSDIAGGIYHQDDAHLNPAEFVRGLASRVRERGGTIREGAEVLGLETSGNRIVAVNTAKGAYRPEQVVLAAGSWSPGLTSDLRLKLPVQPAKGYSATFKRGPKSPSVPLLLAEDKVGLNPMGPVMRLAGTFEFSGLDLTINFRRVNAMIRAAGDYLVDGLESVTAENAWSGLRPCTPDGLPVIGAALSLSNLVVATGHAMLGMTLGPITGKLVAQIVCRQAPMLDPTALSPERFW